MGRFELLVCSARNINAGVQKIGTPDPYVKVCVLDGITKKPSIYKTAVRSNSLAPVWNEVFKFNVGDIDKVQVKVELWNDNVIKDDLLGSYELSLNAFERGVVKDLWVILKKTKLSTTELHLRGLAVDFGSSPPPDAKIVNSLDNDSYLSSRPTAAPPTLQGNGNGNWGSQHPHAMNQGPVIISTTNVFPNSGGYNQYPCGANRMPVPPHLMAQPASSGWMGGQQGPPRPPAWMGSGPPPPPGWMTGEPPPPPGWMTGGPQQQPSGFRSGPQRAQGLPPGAY